MASLLDRVLRVVTRSATRAVTDVVRDELARRSGGSRGAGTTRTSSRQARTSSSRRTSTATPAATSHKGMSVYDVTALGLPTLSYTPSPDGDADPGEVVWTWVPYEEDTSKGKDRPVLVLSRQGGRLVVAQLTSKDHDVDAEQEARWGRYWFDVGSGPWDSKGRSSEVRLDRLLLVEPGAVRREGATMDRPTYDDVAAALREHWS